MTHHEVISNAVENIAFRLAGKGTGIIAPTELLPFLPISLEMITDILNEATSESEAITAETVNGLRCYIFTSASPSGEISSEPANTQCVVCDKNILVCNPILLCDKFSKKLASASRLTLRRMRKKLGHMQEACSVFQERNPKNGTRLYTFSKATCPRDAYRRNLEWIHSLPVSVAEAVEMRVMHILTAIGILFFLLLGMPFWCFPFPLLFLAFLATSPILVVMIWKHRSKLDSMEVE